ncbi:MAG: MlaD family protein, partial [Lactobacillales bacterium]|nr:MlaD family protein [Lactobacillales bacterium]
MKQAYKEILVGVILSISFLGIVLFLHLQSNLPHKKTNFHLYASFTNADGIMKGSQVRLGGITVGEVTGESLSNDYRVKIEMSFDTYYPLPADTSVVIETDGLMGPKHLELMPGGEDDLLRSGEELSFTQ